MTLSNEHRDRLGKWALAVLPRATAYARSLVRDVGRADDLVQECLFRLLQRANRYDLERDGVPLLFRSISNLCITRAAREKSLRSLTGRDGDLPIADPKPIGPDAIAVGKEFDESLGAALAELPEMQRAAVELRALGMSRDEIAAVLEVSPSNAAVLVHRGRKALASALGLRENSGKSV